jgi:hypothetical protein
MKTVQWGVCLLVLTLSCGCKKTGSLKSVTNYAPAPAALTAAGSDDATSAVQPRPLRQTFDDFLYKLFADESYYTLLFDDEADLEREGDTTFTAVQVEWIDLQTRTIKTHTYTCSDGQWSQTATTTRQAADPGDGDFIAFYHRFVTDSLYRRDHVSDPLEYVTIDPDDEFNILETTLSLDGWYAFNPTLPEGKLTNINYGQPNSAESATKIVKVNGIGNGFSNIFYFKKQNGNWELYKYEDTGV